MTRAWSYYKDWLAKHPEYKEKKREWAKKCRIKTRTDVIDMLGGKCVKCGFTDIRALQLDHINGWGSMERKNANDNIAVYRKYRNNPEDARKTLQVLCANCNIIKRDEAKECYKSTYKQHSTTVHSTDTQPSQNMQAIAYAVFIY